MYAKHYSEWLSAGYDAWWLGVESSLVAGMRLTRMAAGGPGAAHEAQLMVVEKIEAAAELQVQLMSNALASTPLGATRRTLRHYRGKVAANRRRLGR